MAYLVENHRQININEVRQRLTDGWLTTYKRNHLIVQKLNVLPLAQGLLFNWRRNNEGQILSQSVRLAYSKTNFNGKRAWFVCPKCGRRCSSLFDFGGAWLCLKCGDLKYSTASLSKSERIGLRIDYLKNKAKAPDWHSRLDLLDDYLKPKWMRWHTWTTIKDEHNSLVDNLTSYGKMRFESML